MGFPDKRGSEPSRGDFSGTGVQMFGQLFLGFVLTFITLGLYGPWFAVGLYRYIYSKSSFGPTARGTIRFEFNGTGGELFVIGLLGMLLNFVTLGIYWPWFFSNLIRFYTDHSVGVADDDTRYQLRYEGTGLQMFVALFVGSLLCLVTLGIYMPWFICKLQRLVLSQTSIAEDDHPCGKFDFVGGGGDLFVTYLIGTILTWITFGIYSAWFQVSMNKFMLSNTRISINGRAFQGDFVGTGGELFVKLFIGALLCIVTLGIYYFWFIADLLKFNLRSTTFEAAQAEGPAA